MMPAKTTAKCGKGSPTVLLVSALVLLLFTVSTSWNSVEAAPVPPQRSAGQSAGSSNGRPRVSMRTGSGQSHGTNGNVDRVQYHNYTIARPGECHEDTIYADCFLCGKIGDDSRLYHDCCLRVPDIVLFCRRLLT